MTHTNTHRIVALALLLTSAQHSSLAQTEAPARGVQADKATIPSETKTRLTLRSQLNSKLNEAGDIITATLTEPVYVEGRLVLQRGTEFRGTITKVAQAKRGQRSSHMSIDFDHIVTPSGEVPISARVTEIDDWDREESMKANNKGDIKGGHRGERSVDNAQRGAQIGFAGGIAGAALGGAAGASGRQILGIGAVGVAAGMIFGLLVTKGSEISVSPGAILRIEFTQPVVLPVTAAPPTSTQ